LPRASYFSLNKNHVILSRFALAFSKDLAVSPLKLPLRLILFLGYQGLFKPLASLLAPLSLRTAGVTRYLFRSVFTEMKVRTFLPLQRRERSPGLPGHLYFTKKFLHLSSLKKGRFNTKINHTALNSMDFQPNAGKNLIIEVGGKKWARYPIKTHFILEKDSLDEVVKKYVLPNVQAGDIVVLGQKIISIFQKRIVYKKDLKVGFWANFLSRFASKTPYGFSVGNPLKMQVAINLAGLPRILFAGLIGTVSKIFGRKGDFYRLAGHQISEIDGFYDKAFSEYGQMGILGPKDCSKICQDLKDRYNISCVIVDVNDIGGKVLGESFDLKDKSQLVLDILKDNPAGQLAQLTPIIVIRPL